MPNPTGAQRDIEENSTAQRYSIQSLVSDGAPAKSVPGAKLTACVSITPKGKKVRQNAIVRGHDPTPRRHDKAAKATAVTAGFVAATQTGPGHGRR